MKQKMLCCPWCGCETIIRCHGIMMYECGYFKSSSGKGKCNRIINLPRHLKPTVRVFHNKSGSPEEVRIVISGPTSKSKMYDQFKGMIKVEADDESGCISSIVLDCNKLGGHECEEALLELMATINRCGHFNVPQFGSLGKAFQKCKKLIGDERIQAKNDASLEEKIKNWGDLHVYLQEYSKGRRDQIQKNLQKIGRKKLMGKKKFRYLDEIIREFMDEHKNKRKN